MNSFTPVFTVDITRFLTENTPKQPILPHPPSRTKKNNVFLTHVTQTRACILLLRRRARARRLARRPTTGPSRSDARRDAIMKW